jgi:hypothetical protein
VSWVAKVDEYAQHHDLSCFLGICQGIYVDFGASPATETSVYYATVNHYYVGWQGSSAYPVNVRGYARHWNLTIQPGTWWTTSDGY